MSGETDSYILSQTMLRVRDPEKSVAFYRDVLGMTLLSRFDFPAGKFSLYFMGYLRPGDGTIPTDPVEAAAFTFRQKGALELTHNWGTETDAGFAGYHNGNAEPRGFGHIGVSVPDVDAACARFEELGADFVKRPNDGAMKGIAFIKDPDGYWIEILSPNGMTALLGR